MNFQSCCTLSKVAKHLSVALWSLSLTLVLQLICKLSYFSGARTSGIWKFRSSGGLADPARQNCIITKKLKNNSPSTLSVHVDGDFIYDYISIILLCKWFTRRESEYRHCKEVQWSSVPRWFERLSPHY